MTSQPLVSVIMIFYQAERFISEAIDSVLSQTMSDWELLLVDDGSTDESTEIALRYARDDGERIRYLEHDSHANRGMAASRKHGMNSARGRYIAFLDADDVFMPTRLEAHVRILERVPAPSIVIGSELYWYSWDTEAYSRPGPRDFVGTTGVTPNRLFRPPELLALLMSPQSMDMPGPCSITFHRLDLDGLEGAPDAFRSLYEDQCLIAILLAHRCAWVTEQCLAKYRMHPASATALAWSRGEESLRPGSPEHHYLLWLKGYLAEHDIAHPALDSALAARLFLFEHPALAHVAETVRRTTWAARAPIVRALRRFFDDSHFDGMRRLRTALRRARVRGNERRLRARS